MATSEKRKNTQNILSNNFVQLGVVALLVVGSFFIGSLWTKVKILEKGGATAQQPTPAAAAQPAQPTFTLAQIKETFNKSFIKLGDSKKKVTFIEISDPSCPYCHIAAGKNKELNSQSDRFKLVEDGGTYLAPVTEMRKLVESGKAAYALIYYPGHGAGEMGAKALYCAFEKGKFWQAHDLLMTNEGYTLLNETIKNDKTKSGEIAQFLSSAVDESSMKSCLDSGKYDSQLATDQKLATSLGVQGTPGFFVNETQFSGAYSFTDMKPAVDAALK